MKDAKGERLTALRRAEDSIRFHAGRGMARAELVRIWGETKVVRAIGSGMAPPAPPQPALHERIARAMAARRPSRTAMMILLGDRRPEAIAEMLAGRRVWRATGGHLARLAAFLGEDERAIAREIAAQQEARREARLARRAAKREAAA